MCAGRGPENFRRKHRVGGGDNCLAIDDEAGWKSRGPVGVVDKGVWMYCGWC